MQSTGTIGATFHRSLFVCFLFVCLHNLAWSCARKQTATIDNGHVRWIRGSKILLSLVREKSREDFCCSQKLVQPVLLPSFHSSTQKKNQMSGATCTVDVLPATAVVMAEPTESLIRPPGTRSGGKWYTQKLQSGDTRPLYRCSPEEYLFYTLDGIQVQPKPSTLTFLQKDSATVATNTPVQQWPIDSVPGGKWFKQAYRGKTSENYTLAAFCCMGLWEGFMVSNMAFDNRFVYCPPNSDRYVDMHGKFVNVHNCGGLTPMPPGWHPYL